MTDGADRSSEPYEPCLTTIGSGLVHSTALWENLVRVHRGRVYRLAYRLTRDQHDADDLTQDVFDRVLRRLPSCTSENFDGWLYRITVNLFRDRMRRARRIRMEPLTSYTADRHASGHPCPERTVTESVFVEDIHAALAALHPDLRTAVLLCDVEGLSYDEIAAVLHVKRNTVGSWIHRGRSTLRASLSHRTPFTPHTGPDTSPRAAA